jgi:hypothetical protein
MMKVLLEKPTQEDIILQEIQSGLMFMKRIFVDNGRRYLGDKMWFNYMTVEPVIGKSSKFFTAVPLNKKEN